jgi:hypothetical protein
MERPLVKMMSKQYLVFYYNNYEEKVFVQGKDDPTGMQDVTYAQDHTETKHSSALSMKVCTTEEEAVEYATKYNGYIVIPAQVTSKVSES